MVTALVTTREQATDLPSWLHTPQPRHPANRSRELSAPSLNPLNPEEMVSHEVEPDGQSVSSA